MNSQTKHIPLLLIIILTLLIGQINPAFSGQKGGKQLAGSPLTLNTPCFNAETKGTIRQFIGLAYRHDWEAPIYGLQGDLWQLGYFRFDFYFSERVVIKLTGGAQDVLNVKGQNGPIFLDPVPSSVSDVKDFSIATLAFFNTGHKWLPDIGFRIETKLPNTDQKYFLGTNTTDLLISIMAAYRGEKLTVFGDMGVDIMTTPIQINNQNDVLLYGLGWIWILNSHLQLAGEINGYHSTHLHTPIGTESRGVFRCGLVWGSPRLTLEIFPLIGLAERSGTFGLSMGLSWQFNILGKKQQPGQMREKTGRAKGK